ncbi:MAG TPA: DUF4157 domain-containing protein, partial [Thermoanaerobaculia bacterium]|nr:DUF4157 domain-containing protein [Thermoanaerobaculia bacterium]
MAHLRTALPQPPSPAPAASGSFALRTEAEPPAASALAGRPAVAGSAPPAPRMGGEMGTLASVPLFGSTPGGGAFRIQPKLRIGPPGDRHEREADRVASQVVDVLRAPPVEARSAPAAVQRQAEVSSLPSPSEELLQGCDACGGTCEEPQFERTLQRAREGGGESFPQAVRQPMERAFGADFSGVTVHRDRQSDQLNHAIHARAFTTGQDIFFRRGEYNPASRGGQELLAHELTHVVQQGGPEVRRASAETEGHAGAPALAVDGAEPEGVVQRACTRAECGADPEVDAPPSPPRKRRRLDGDGDGGGAGSAAASAASIDFAQLFKPNVGSKPNGMEEDKRIPIATRLENGRSSVPTLQRRSMASSPAVGSGALFLNVAAVPGRGGTLVQRAGIVTGALNTGAAYPTALAGAPAVVAPAYTATGPNNTATNMKVKGLHRQA